MRGVVAAVVTSIALVSVAGASLVLGRNALQPSDVVLVFDVSDSILQSTDGTNVEFADALDGIADRVDVVAADLASGNAAISFVAFGRTAIPYPANCGGLKLHEDPAAIARFEACLRSVAAEYRAGTNAPVRTKIDTQATDHVAALNEAAGLLPDTSSRSAVIFFTDGEHDPPGTARDNENVPALVAPAFEGRTPLAILPVGLGAGAGAFESELATLYTSFIRDMAPCAGRPNFAWPEVVFPSADAAGTAVALALQEVTCSFTVAPTQTPTPTQVPTALPAVFGQPIGVRALAANRSLTIQWLPPSTGAELVTDYLVRCTPPSGGAPIESTEGVSTELETEITGLEAGVGYACEVAATDGVTVGPWSARSAAVVVLGVPSAPSQPRVEALDSAARLSVDPATGGLVEQYIYECTAAAGTPIRAADTGPTVVVSGLTNGETYQCVAYAESSVGRSPASAASASFSPCSSFLDCNPWSRWVIAGLVLAILAGGAWFARQRYQHRSRVWVTAQVDGGENRPLGWGPELGIRLEQHEAGWVATPLPPEGAAVRIRYRGENRFLITAGTHITDVHQGDAAPVRDEAGTLHNVTLRRYRDQPHARGGARSNADTDATGSSAVQARLPGFEDGVAGAPEPPLPESTPPD